MSQRSVRHQSASEQGQPASAANASAANASAANASVANASVANMSVAGTVGHRVAPRVKRRRMTISVVVSLVVIALVVICAAFGPWLWPHDPTAQDLLHGSAGPSWAHLLGTDDAGRDIASRVIAGTRDAVLGPAVITVGSLAAAILLGLNAGYRGGWTDSIIMRILDVSYSLPGALVAIVVLGVVGGGYWTAVFVLIFLGVPVDTRIIRGAALEQRKLPYIDAARTLNLSTWRIMFAHILPNIKTLILANVFLDFAAFLVSMSALAFLGLGLPPGSTEWGSMLSANLSNLATNPLAALAPGFALVLVGTMTNLFGDWLFEHANDRGDQR